MMLLGIDLGTSSAKALVAASDARILGRGSVEYGIERLKADWAEQSPETWWEATVDAVRKATSGLGRHSGAISAIGLSGQMHGTVLLDAAGQPLSPAVIWPDRRSRQQVSEITELIGSQRLIGITGSPLAAGFQAATLRWFQQERPALWGRVATVLTPKDYMRWRFAGEIGSEPSDGSGTLLLDASRRDWSADILSVLDIDPRLLPKIRSSTAIAGHLTKEAARELGLPTGIPVVSGAADTACGLLGAGVVDPGALLLTLGSGGQLVAPVLNVEVDLQGRLHTFCGALEPSQEQPGWYQMGAILAAGLSLRWLRDQVFELKEDNAYEEMTSMAARVPDGANGLLFLPYLLGERTPHMDPRARGLFLGLTLEHGRADLVRAVMEGVVMACYDAFSAMAEVGARPEHIVMAGGGARSPLWRQIVADVFDLPVRAVKTGEQSALGAALLAGGGLNLFEPATMAREWAEYEAQVNPNGEAHELYSQLFSLFRGAYQEHSEDFQSLWRM